MAESLSFADSGRLLARVASAAQSGEHVTFLVGSALTAPGSSPQEKGVPDVNSLIEEVVKIFRGTDEFGGLEEVLNRPGTTSRYQDAMQFVIDCRGQDTLNHLIMGSVLKARNTPVVSDVNPEQAEMDTSGWYLRPAVEAIGQLVTENPGTFSAPILTSNFDPLLEVSIRKARGHAETIILSADGQFTNVLSVQSKVVHFHGFWRGSDTLHTPTQLTRYRPQLKGSLRSLLRETTLVVMGYGGWSDVFTRTLVDVIGEQMEELNVLWTFYSGNDEDIVTRNKLLLEEFGALAGQRVVFYKGVDCHVFLPRLREKLLGLQKPASLVTIEIASPQEVRPVVRESTEGGDRPPIAEAWVGRETELRQTLSSSSKVIAVTGFGGIGKSTLAAKYLELRQGAGEIAYSCWADCREQSNTLHTQLVRMVERVSGGAIRSSQLANSGAENVIEVLLDILGNTRAILVFDNIDKYIDVEECKAVGSMDMLIQMALSRNHSAQFVFTCRPKLDYSDARFLEIQLAGLSIDETRRLFEVRGVLLDPSKGSGQMADAHGLTRGHALTLNLIATQVAKNKADLDELLAKLKSGVEAGVENPIFNEIWVTLNERQQTVLRYLAELVHPEPEQRAGTYLGNALNYNQFSKAIKSLKAMNLVVVKSSRESGSDTIELHPLVRDFIRRRFPKSDRAPYIDSIIRICDQVIGRFRGTILSVPFSVLENWTAKVELCLERDRYAEALETLAEVDMSLRKIGYSEEFVRLAIELLDKYKPTEDEEEIARLDAVYKALITTLSDFGRYKEADLYIDRMGQTIVGKTARYVLFCDTRVRQAREAAARVRDLLPNTTMPPVDDWECERAYRDWLRKN